MGSGVEEGPEPALDAWAPSVHGALLSELRALLGLGEGARVAAVERPDLPPGPCGPLEVTLTTGRGDLAVEVADAAPDRPAWVRGRRLQLLYRALAGGRDPRASAFGPLLDAMGARFLVEEARRADALAAALAADRQARGLRDYMLRAVTPAEGGALGTLRLGFRCNQDCGFCWQERDWPAPPDERFFRWLDAMAAGGVRRLVVSGGEPTLHPALPALVERAARGHGMHVQLETNAIRLRRRDYTARLVEAGLAGLFASLHSADPAVSDAMTRAPGTHGPTIAGLHAALDAGLDVVVNCVVERANVGGLEDHAAFVLRELVEAHPDNPVRHVTYSHPTRYRDGALYDRSVAPLDEVRPRLVAAARRLVAAGVQVDVMGPCGFPACAVHGAPELVRATPPEDLAPESREGRAHAAVCAGCEARRHCSGPWQAYLDVHGDRGLVPFAEDPRPPRYLDGTGTLAEGRGGDGRER